MTTASLPVLQSYSAEGHRRATRTGLQAYGLHAAAAAPQGAIDPAVQGWRACVHTSSRVAAPVKRLQLRRKAALHLLTSTGRVCQSTEQLRVLITTPASSSSMQQHEATVAQTWIFVCRRTLVTCQWRPRCPRGGPQVGCTVLMIAVLACDSRAVYMSHRATWKGGELRTRVCDLCAVHTTGPP